MIEPGQQAPDFTLTDQHGAKHTLSGYRGDPVVVYFYPKDDTPGCTKEACSFRDNWDALRHANVTVFGISADDVASHAAFATKYNLPFPILADPTMDVIRAWGAWGTKNMYGKLSEGIMRYTYVLDAEGVVTKVFKRPKTDIHAEEVLAALAK
jgi:peroxiredoxin Q/BCP